MSQLDKITQKLIELDEDILKAQLAIQEQQITNSLTSRLWYFFDGLEVELMVAPKGGFDQNTINFGDRLFKKLSVRAHHLMCSDLFDDQELKQKIQATYQENSDKAAALLAPALASHLGLVSSISMILAVLIIKTLASATTSISSATYETIFELWKTKISYSIDSPDLSISEIISSAAIATQ
ncbi:conserved hypothetical protein [Planktothrix sp. PCC 11201]|uniref:hypothetical protein n=1 Tax=Planktothrix sp. PCC 11201 TaxID=1729650 RepID=UPI000915BEA7|nr:hypothetical protein [Planktothrix sp. PCC 11201]SKB11122.1 conserved hypothetical protein [Planktothrix sp. PCC 11201]